jgi:nitric oxide dioxygenase
MANDLIAIEKKLYAEAGVEPAEVWRTVVVRARIQESPDTVSFVLALPDGAALPTACPGQYISVA